MASVSSVTKVQLDGGLWTHVFGNQNASWIFDQRQISGNFFLGLQGQTSNVFAAGIPRGAVIESAFMRVWAYSNSSADPYVTYLNSPIRNDGSLLRRPLVNPTLPFTGWRTDQWSNANMSTLNTTLSLQQQTSGGTSNLAWTMRQLDAMGTGAFSSTWRDRMAQYLLPTSTYSIGAITVEFAKNGAPAGNVRLQIMGAVLDGGLLVPDETVLATSDVRTLASIPAGPSSQLFNFTGADQISLVNGTSYFIVIVPDTYAADNVNNLVVRYQNTFLSNGGLRHYGTDRDSRWQHYPGAADADAAFIGARPAGQIGPDIAWNIPTFVIASQYDTPDISPIVQAQVNAEEYVGSDEAIIVTTAGNSGNFSRIWRSANFVNTNFVPELHVTWRPPRRIVI